MVAVDTSSPRLAVQGTPDIALWRDDWRRMEHLGMTTVYQTEPFASAWYAALAAAEGLEPLVIRLSGTDGAAIALLPLVVERAGPVRVARFAGASHSNHNLGVFDPARLAELSPPALAECLREIGEANGIDAFDFRRMPVTWNGHANPLAAALHATPCPTIAQLTRLDTTFEQLLASHNGGAKRKKAKTKERILREAGDYRVAIASEPDEIREALDAFFAQKAQRLAEQGINDPFSAPGCRAFFDRLARPEQCTPVLELAYLAAGGKIRAVFGLGVFARRASLMVLSYSQDELTKASPGETLLYRLMEILCARDIAVVDYGVGRERYKDSWADAEEPLVDGRLAVTALGRLYVAASDIRDGLERSIRNSPRAWALFKRLRSWRARGARITLPAADADAR